MNVNHSCLLVLAQSDEPAPGRTWLDTINSAGAIGYVIIGLSVLALAMVVVHLVQIRRKALLPPEQLEALDGLLARGDVAGAVAYCSQPEHDSFLTRVMAGGLIRFQRSAFGAFEIKNAIEEAGQEQAARLYRSTDVLGVIGSIGPLLGLLGTVLGIVGAFDTLSTGASPDHKTLAGNISLALVTTLLGLVVAIPCTALFTYFRNRIDALAGEAGVEIERLLLHLESARTAPAPARPAAYRPSGPAVAAGLAAAPHPGAPLPGGKNA